MTANQMIDEKFNLFKSHPKYTYDKKKEDYFYVSPSTSTNSNLNSKTGSLLFDIGATDAWLDLPKMALIAEMKVTVAAGKNITLENNFFPHMFPQIVLQLNGNAFQTVDYPGIVDSIIKHVTLPRDFPETMGAISGWLPDQHDGKPIEDLTISDPVTNVELTNIVNRMNLENINKGYQLRKKYYTPKTGDNYFTIDYPLKTIFGFLDYKAYSTQFKWSLKLVKDINIDRLFHGIAGSVNTDVTISFENLTLRIPKITPSVHIEPSLIKQITSDKKAVASVLNRQINTQTLVAGGTNDKLNWEITKSTSNPRYVLLGFKETSTADNILENNSKFINHNEAKTQYIKSCQLTVDSVNYPEAAIIIHDGTLANIFPAFDLYEKMCYKFGNIPGLDINEFDNLYTIFCFDLSAAEELLKKGAVNVKLKIERNTIACSPYVVILEDALYHLDYKTGLIVSEN